MLTRSIRRHALMLAPRLAMLTFSMHRCYSAVLPSFSKANLLCQYVQIQREVQPCLICPRRMPAYFGKASMPHIARCTSLTSLQSCRTIKFQLYSLRRPLCELSEETIRKLISCGSITFDHYAHSSSLANAASPVSFRLTSATWTRWVRRER